MWVVVAAILTAATMLFVLYIQPEKQQLRRAASRMMKNFIYGRYERVYDQMSESFKSSFSLRQFSRIPYVGFEKPPIFQDVEYDIERVIMTDEGGEANVIVSMGYSKAVQRTRYTMRWVREPEGWAFVNPDYARYRTMAINEGL